MLFKIFLLIFLLEVSLASKAYPYVGCFTDDLGNRMFEEVSYMDGTLSPENCATYCKSKQYRYMGLEWARDCRCGNSLKDRKTYPILPKSSCSMVCPGNSKERCGQFSIMSVYETGYKGKIINFSLSNIKL